MSVSDDAIPLDPMYNVTVDDDEDKPHSSVRLLNARRTAALTEIDNARFGWFHFRVALVAGVGFFTDAYDLFAIDIASVLLGYVYGHYNNSLNQNQLVGLKVAALAGNLVGQVLFGWLADRVGRKRMYGFELMIMIAATFCQALAGGAPSVNIVGALIVWRFIVGVGVGGDYPLSAIISAEFAATRSRGRFMAAVFAAQGWGQFAASTVALVSVAAYKGSISNPPDSTDVPIAFIDQIWRILIGFGCIPALIALYFRLTIPETPRFTMDIERNVKQATENIDNVLATGTYSAERDALVQRVIAPMATKSDFLSYFLQWENGKVLLGTAYSWFALDFAFYVLNLNNSSILRNMGFTVSGANNTTTPPTRQQIYKILIGYGVGNLVLSVAGLIPGYWACFFLIDKWGRKPIQFTGFIALTILFLIMGYGGDGLVKAHLSGLYVFFYCLAMFFQNFGPNTTTFIIPGEAFPTRYRSTAHGISAAAGKLGGVISQLAFMKINYTSDDNDSQVSNLMKTLAFVMLTGVVSTMLLPETKGRSLEAISNEEQEGFVQGVIPVRQMEIA